MSEFTALIMDIEKSRQWDTGRRTRIQNRILKNMNVLNRFSRSGIRFEVDFSAGDEVQGLFYTPSAAYLYSRLFRLLLLPVVIRTGLGIGPLTVEIENGRSAMQDGPAYHRAREAEADPAVQSDEVLDGLCAGRGFICI